MTKLQLRFIKSLSFGDEIGEAKTKNQEKTHTGSTNSSVDFNLTRRRLEFGSSGVAKEKRL